MPRLYQPPDIGGKKEGQKDGKKEIHVEEDVDSLLECPICLEQFQDPRVLPCLHTLCYRCLVEHIRGSADCTGLYFPCPTCREGTTVPPGGAVNFPKHFFINKLSDILSKKNVKTKKKPVKEIKCASATAEQAHSEPTVYCVECEAHFCQECTDSHQRFKALKQHHFRQVSFPPKKTKSGSQTKSKDKGGRKKSPKQGASPDNTGNAEAGPGSQANASGQLLSTIVPVSENSPSRSSSVYLPTPINLEQPTAPSLSATPTSTYSVTSAIQPNTAAPRPVAPNTSSSATPTASVAPTASASAVPTASAQAAAPTPRSGARGRPKHSAAPTAATDSTTPTAPTQSAAPTSSVAPTASSRAVAPASAQATVPTPRSVARGRPKHSAAPTAATDSTTPTASTHSATPTALIQPRRAVTGTNSTPAPRLQTVAPSAAQSGTPTASTNSATPTAAMQARTSTSTAARRTSAPTTSTHSGTPRPTPTASTNSARPTPTAALQPRPATSDAVTRRTSAPNTSTHSATPTATRSANPVAPTAPTNSVAPTAPAVPTASTRSAPPQPRRDSNTTTQSVTTGHIKHVISTDFTDPTSEPDQKYVPGSGKHKTEPEPISVNPYPTITAPPKGIAPPEKKLQPAYEKTTRSTNQQMKVPVGKQSTGKPGSVISVNGTPVQRNPFRTVVHSP